MDEESDVEMSTGTDTESDSDILGETLVIDKSKGARKYIDFMLEKIAKSL